MHFILEAACGSDVGKIRQNNEDNYFFDNKVREIDDSEFIKPVCKTFDGDAVCFGVFDGLGGADDGQIASYLAANVLKNDFEHVENTGMMSEAFFNNSVVHMNEKVCVEASGRKNKMGTTFVGACFCENRVYLCNVGDSRAYRLRDDALVQISKDHVEEIPPFMRGKRGVKAPLSQCIGTPVEELLIEPYVVQGEVKKGDIYLFCSDGITDMLTDEQIYTILTKCKDSDISVQMLINTALSHGGKDNATAIVVEVKEKQ